MDRAEKPMKLFEKKIQHLDVDRRKKMCKNKRKPIHEKNLTRSSNHPPRKYHLSEGSQTRFKHPLDLSEYNNIQRRN